MLKHSNGISTCDPRDFQIQTLKKPKCPKPNEKRRREPGRAQRENPRRSEPLPSFSLPSCHLCPDSALVVPLHCSIWVCLSPAKLQPSFFLNSSPTQAPSPKPPSLTHFGVCVSVSVWVSAFMFVFQSGFRAVFVFRYGFRRLCLCFNVDFKLGFKLCLHFGFVFRVWVSASLCILGWVFAGCS